MNNRAKKVLLAEDSPQGAENGFRPGVNVYAVKPVSFQKIVNTVKQIGAFRTIHSEPVRTT